jgi:ABC-type transport system involved in cytochrome bd biosynthesis fused ATPase/permease subunit
MFAAPIHERWLLRLGAVAIVVLLATAAILLSIALGGDTTSVLVAVCFLVAPPLFLMATVLSGRLMLDFGVGERSKGELERLLETKRETTLKLDARQFWKVVTHHVQVKIPEKKPVPLELAHHVQLAIKKSPAPVNDVAEVLDHLIDWKRQVHRAPRTKTDHVH